MQGALDGAKARRKRYVKLAGDTDDEEIRGAAKESAAEVRALEQQIAVASRSAIDDVTARRIEEAALAGLAKVRERLSATSDPASVREAFAAVYPGGLTVGADGYATGAAVLPTETDPTGKGPPDQRASYCVCVAGYDLVVLSPHPDDAVFSTGGAILREVQAGRRVAVVTVFGVTLEDRARRADEDAAAIAHLGAERLDLALDEAPLRDPACRTVAGLFAPLPPSEEATIARVVRAVRAGVPLAAAATILAPFGVGEHRDHQVVHAAAARIEARSDGSRAVDVRYYEDLPYAFARFSVERRRARLGDRAARPSAWAAFRGRAEYFARLPLVEEAAGGWPLALVAATIARHAPPLDAPPGPSLPAVRFEAEDVPMADLLDDKLAAIAEYASQWPQFARTLDDWRRLLATHAARLGAPLLVERRWRRTA